MLSKVKNYIFEILILVVLIILYSSYIPVWISLWSDFDSFYAFGFFMLAFIGYLFKENFEEYKKIEKKPSYSWSLPFLIGGLILYMLGIRADFEYFVSLSLPVFIAGIILMLYGPKFFKAMLFPLILFAFVLPVFPLHRITLPMQLFSADLTTHLLTMFNINAFNEGNIIYIEQYRVAVVPGCSGLKSLYSLFFIGVIYSYFINAHLIKKILFVFSSIPLALFMNVLRITVVGFYVLYNGQENAEHFHDDVGLVVYILSFGVIFLISRLIEEKQKEDIDEE